VGTVTLQAQQQCLLPEGTPVCTGGHDYLCAALACGWTAREGIFNVLGTYEMISLIRECASPAVWDERFRPFSDLHVMPNHHTVTIEFLSGIHLNWFVSEYLVPAGLNFSDVTPFSAEPGRIAYDPATGLGAAGFRTDFENADPDAVYKAILEGLCYRSKESFRYMESQAGASGLRICSVGGGSSSDYWMQLKADILNTQICVPQLQEASGTGAAILAAVGSGYYRNFSEALVYMAPKDWKYYNPDPERAEKYKIPYEEWLKGGNLT